MENTHTATTQKTTTQKTTTETITEYTDITLITPDATTILKFPVITTYTPIITTNGQISSNSFTTDSALENLQDVTVSPLFSYSCIGRKVAFQGNFENETFPLKTMFFFLKRIS